MVSSSSFVQLHESVDAFFPGEPHVEESSGKEDRSRVCGSEIEAYTFDFKNVPNERQTSSLDSGASNVPKKLELVSNSVSGSTWKHARDRVQNLATSSQEWKKDNRCPGSTRTLVLSDVCERSGSWTSTICKSPTIDSLRKFSRTLDRHRVSVLMNSTRRPTY